MPLLDVPYFKQFNQKACVPAAVTMILQFKGKKTSQRKLFDDAKTYDPSNHHIIWGCTEVGIMKALRGDSWTMDWWAERKKKKMLPLHKEWWDAYNREISIAKKKKWIRRHHGADFTLIKKNIDARNPIIAEVHWNTWLNNQKSADDITHFVVIVGYTPTQIIVNDPYSPYLGKKGKNVKVPIAHFKKAWRASPYYKNIIISLSK